MVTFVLLLGLLLFFFDDDENDDDDDDDECTFFSPAEIYRANIYLFGLI